MDWRKQLPKWAHLPKTLQGWVLAGFTGTFGWFIAANATNWIAAKKLDRLFVDGDKFMTQLGYGDVIAYGFWFTGGICLALWLNYWLKKRENRLAERTSIAFRWDGSWEVELDGETENIHQWYVETQGPTVKVTLIYEKHIVDSDVAIISTTPDVTWEEAASSERFLKIKIDGRQDNTRLTMMTIPLGEKDRKPAKGIRKAIYAKGGA